MKLAKRYTCRTGIISFRNAYHGGTHGALSVTGNERMKNAFRPLLPDVTQIEFNNFKELQHITEKTACVIAETIQAEAGIILPGEGFLQALRKRCSEVGALFVIDDVQMGFGRTGKLFSFEHYGIVPDILALAKALGGGMPLGAFISSQEIMRALTSEPELGHITTFGGHPVSCAAALAHLDELTKGNLVAEAEAKGKLIEELLKDHPAIQEIRRSGLMTAVDLGYDEKMQQLYPVLLERGIVTDLFLFRPSAFRISPPLIITEEQIKEVCKIIIDCLDVI
jgi:acetylornithine/succinyldiaminopimelate/putrescine aminotransferase